MNLFPIIDVVDVYKLNGIGTVYCLLFDRQQEPVEVYIGDKLYRSDGTYVEIKSINQDNGRHQYYLSDTHMLHILIDKKLVLREVLSTSPNIATTPFTRNLLLFGDDLIKLQESQNMLLSRINTLTTELNLCVKQYTSNQEQLLHSLSIK